MQTLTLSGWTQPVDALFDVVPHAISFDYSDYPDADAAIEGLSVFKDMKGIVAWSMGANLLLRAISANALAPEHVLLIAPPYQFVNRDGFVDGMDTVTFSQFRNNYAHDTQRTVDRFHALIAKGDSKGKEVMKQLHHHPAVTDTGRWLPWLDALGIETLKNLTLPAIPRVKLLHGENDHITPVAQSCYIQALIANIKVERWQDVGHAPHLHDAARFRDWVGS